MTKKEKDLLIADLCARLPYDVKVLYNNKVYGIDYVSGTYEEIKLDDINVNYTLNISEVKPYLFPLSSITNEEKEEYCNLQQRIICNNKVVVNEDVKKYINYWYKKHLDINNLISLGLAIDATNLNIY